MADDRRNIDSCNLSLSDFVTQRTLSLSRYILMAAYGGLSGPAFGSQLCMFYFLSIYPSSTVEIKLRCKTSSIVLLCTAASSVLQSKRLKCDLLPCPARVICI